MSQTKMKLWVSLGASVVMGANGMAVAAEPQHAHSAMMQVAQGGEGGEAGHEHGGFESLSEDQSLAGNLMLLRGHLLVGSELYTAGRADDAVIHYLHPAEEIYNEIAAGLAARGVTGMATDLNALSAAVKGKKPQAEVAALQTKVEAAVAEAQPKLATPALAQVLATVLQTAADEYAIAYEGGSLSNAAEYQDARGFVWTAESEVKANPALASLAEGIAALKAAWPGAVPPKSPAMSVDEVSAKVAALVERCAEVK